MDKFSVFLTEKHEGSNRTKRSSMKELHSLLDEYSVEELRSILGSSNEFSKMYRGDKVSSRIAFIDPSVSRRFSPYAYNNFYNLYLSNADAWKKYPSREYSVVCSTGFSKASTYNNSLYIMIPKKRNAKIAIATADDIWTSFIATVGDLDKLNREMFTAVKLLDRGARSPWDENWEETKAILKDYNKEFVDNPETDQMFVTQFAAFLIEKYGSFYEALNILLDPEKNDFKLQPFETFMKSKHTNKEVWTDAPCFMIRVAESLDILYELTKEKK